MNRGLGRALTWVGLIVAVLMIGGGTLSMVSLFWLRSENVTQSYPVSPSLRVESNCGDVTVTAGGADRIGLSGRVWWSFTKPTITSSVTAGAQVVKVICPDLSFGTGNTARVTVTVPESTAVTVRATGGSVTLQGLAGTVDVSTDGGRVRAFGLRSSAVTARSSAGAVRLSFTSAPQTVVAASSGGGVEVLVPEGSETYRVSAESSASSAKVTVKTDQASGRTIEARSSAGGVRVAYVG